MADIPHHADDLDVAARLRSAETKMKTDRVLIREEFPGHHLADHCHPGRALGVGRGEFTAAQQSDAHRLEELRANLIAADLAPLLRHDLLRLRPHVSIPPAPKHPD